MGNKAWTLELEWPGKTAFLAAGDHSWVVEGKAAGLARTAQGFTFLQVFEAGHMVPMDQPLNSLAMASLAQTSCCIQVHLYQLLN
jgi:cathepsin A (carboxypeptidase C)